jgi:myosin heavy subunit
MSEAEERRVLRDLYESTAADADDLTLLTTIDDANIASHLSARLSNEEKMYTAIGAYHIEM